MFASKTTELISRIPKQFCLLMVGLSQLIVSEPFRVYCLREVSNLFLNGSNLTLTFTSFLIAGMETKVIPVCHILIEV